MKIFNTYLTLVLGVAIAAAALGDDDNARLDELGQIPRLHAKLDGEFDSSGDEAIAWDKKSLPRSPKWVESRNSKALKIEDSTPCISNLKLGDEWTITVIAKGAAEENGIIWSIGSARGKGTRAIALASTGKGGAKLVTWWGRDDKNKLLAMKDVIHFDKQFHVYSVTYSDETKTIALWVDGKKAGESKEFNDADKLGAEFMLGAFHWLGDAGGLKKCAGIEIDDIRVYDTALTEVQQLQIASGNQPWPEGLPRPKERISAYIDTNAVLRLGYEIPEQVVIGNSGEKRLYAKGVLAQCTIGGEKRFELDVGGQFALGSGGLVFDSNYAKGRNNEIVFKGGTLLNFEPTFIKSASPIKLEGDTKLKTMKTMAIRSSIEGGGNLEKTGPGILGLQYPCDKATGKLSVMDGSTLRLGNAASWGGVIELGPGSTLICASTNQIAKIIAGRGAKIQQTNPLREYGENVFPQPACAYNLKKMQRERMGRGVYAVRQNEKEVMIGWRYKSTDPTNLAFNVYANGVKLNNTPITDVTYYKTPWTGKRTKYEVKWIAKDGREATFPVSGSWTLGENAPIGYFDIELTPPPDTKMPDGKLSKHIPYDCSIGDLDGDGEYELVVIWWPDNGADNSSWHKTGDTWIEGVKLDGTNRSLWKINLGPNIRSGSHYTPVMVADFDGDGKAEVICRTAEGTVDGKGLTQGADGKFAPGAEFFDWRSHIEGAHILWARNFTTVFSGLTGAAIDSVPFKPDVLSDEKLRNEAEAKLKANPKHADSEKWSKAINREWSSRNPGNQAFRMLGAVAYLDGFRPSVVMCRGYYSRTCLCAYDFDGKKLQEKWYFCSDDQRWWGYGGNGFHNLRVGDVDFDGRDEIIYGHMVVDHDGKGLYSTGMGHGDAMHLIQGSPTMRGLQVWTCHEAPPYGVSLFDAQTGRIHFWTHGPMDTGSCNAMDIDPTTPGVELFSGAHCGIYSAATNERYMKPKPNPKDNYYSTLRFGIWWKGDMTRSAYSGGTLIRDYSIKGRSVSVIQDLAQTSIGASQGVHSNHSTKGCPNLIADLFGDWREEIFLTRNDNRAIRIYMSPFDTPYRFHTFMEDPIYRISVLTQNNGYNVPTGTGFYFGPDLLGHDIWFRGCHLK
ncbi:MAG: VCBS repeat-containing protein [Kiritimatiellae bacterium]|nr:VCBS repeat-containing protein [Kiritimatiellia bacterium]